MVVPNNISEEMIKLFDYGSRIFTYRELQVNCVISWKCSIKIILTKISECDWVAVDWRTLMSLIYASQLGLSSSVFLRWEFLKENKKTRFRPRKWSRKKERKHALGQESDQEKKRKNINCQEKKKENTLSTKKATKKKRKTVFTE